MKKRENSILVYIAALIWAITGAVQAATIYAVNASGQIRSYTGAATGVNPVEGNTVAGGTLETTVSAYASYLGFTQAGNGRVYGVNASGGVDRWDSLPLWLVGASAVSESVGVYGASGVHGISYDGNTGGFYVVYEGNGMQGDVGQYATLDDFINNANASVSDSVYTGNILNFYYPDADSSAGSMYYQVAGSGRLEGFTTLANYIASSGNGTAHSASGDFSGVGAAFALVSEDASALGLLPPENATAVATNGQIRLDWSPSEHAESYNIYRSTTSGSYGSPLQTGVENLFYVDSAVNNYTTYYYALSSVSNGIESVPSEGVAVMPVEGTYAPHNNLNVLFIFIDDMGWGDMGCYGNTVTTKDGGLITPNLDTLAGQGIRFTEGYVGAPICSPSRVCVMTGIESQRYAIYSYLNTTTSNDGRNMNDWLDPYTVAAPRLFRDAGYRTGQFGKWHMGGGRDVNHAPFPQAYGFQESLVAFEGMGDRVLYNNSGLSTSNADVEGDITWAERYEGADLHAAAAIDFISRAVQSNKNFYVHVPFNDVHDPYDTDPGKESDFDHITDNTTAQMFLSELHELDMEIGRLVQAVDDLGAGSNTLVVIVGDNGAPDNTLNDILNRNGGLRGGKGNLFEGGFREPYIVRCPGLVPAGQVNSSTAVSTLDLLPTYCSFAGIKLPNAPFAGEDMSDVFLGATRSRERPLFWEYGTVSGLGSPSPKLAMREGDYKLLVNPDGSDRQFYNLASDKEETTNLASDSNVQSILASMQEQLFVWYTETILGEVGTSVEIPVEPIMPGIVIRDDYSVTGDDAPNAGFGSNDGVNYDFLSRITGMASTNLSGYRWGGGGRPASDFTITGNRLDVIPRDANARFEFTDNGTSGFDFGPWLAGNRYELSVQMDIDVVGTSYAERMSLSLGDSSNLAVGNVDLGIQIGTDGAGGLGVFKRIDAGSHSGTGDINVKLASGYPIGTPIDLQVVVQDYNSNTTDYASSYEIFINGSSVDSGSFRFNGSSSARYLIFDTAAQEGDVYYDNVQLEVTEVLDKAPSVYYVPVLSIAEFGPDRIYWNVLPDMIVEPQNSTNLTDWISQGLMTNEYGTIQWLVPPDAGGSQVFYRLK